MGSDDLMESDPVHDVELDSCYIDITEVTVAAYRAYAKAGSKVMPAAPQWGWSEDHPISNVSWSEAKEYCDKAGKRLPTEAQWEKGKADGRVNQLGSEDGFGTTAPVGSYPGGQSPYGVFDMAGNVWEWCADWYDADYYVTAPSQAPQGPATGRFKVLRGGSWINPGPALRSSNRFEILPIERGPYIGFRCVEAP